MTGIKLNKNQIKKQKISYLKDVRRAEIVHLFPKSLIIFRLGINFICKRLVLSGQMLFFAPSNRNDNNNYTNNKKRLKL